jgi:hypothetical protein
VGLENPIGACLDVKSSDGLRYDVTHRIIDEFSEAFIQASQNRVRRASLPVTMFDID